MRKSERIRILELQVLELQKNLEMLTAILGALVEQETKLPNLDAGKWYQKKP